MSNYTEQNREEAVAIYRGGNSATEVSRQTGASVSAISRWVKKAGITRDRYECQGIPSGSEEKAIELYANDGKSSYEISKILNVSRPAISRWIKKRGLTRDKYSIHGTTEDDRKKAVKMYADGVGTKTIARNIGVVNSTISAWLRHQNVSMRSMSEAQSMRASQGRQPIRGVRSSVTTRFGVIRADSVFEAARICQLDGLDSVTSISRAKDAVEWLPGHRYTPDLMVQHGGCIVIEEVKPSYRRYCDEVTKKEAAAREFFKHHGWRYEIVTEKEMGIAAFDAIDIKKISFNNDTDKKRFFGALRTAIRQCRL